MAINDDLRLGNIFDFRGGNSGLTEEFIYNNQSSTIDGQIPIFSGSATENNPMGFISDGAKPHGKPLKVFYKTSLIVVRKGKAGKMKYITNNRFATNDDVYVLIPKKEWKDRIDLKWFMYQYQNMFYNLVTSKSDNATFNKDYAEKQRVIMPDLTEQLAQIKDKLYLETLKSENLKLIDSIEDLKNQTKMFLQEKARITLSEIFNFIGGNSGLTEELIYNNQPKTDDDRTPILSSATLEANLMGHISRESLLSNKMIVFTGDCILVARNGYAGTMTYISDGEFTTNDHTYVLIPKKEWKDRINLRWFVYQYQDLFYSLITSKSDNATFNKEYAEKQKIMVPDKDAVQDIIAERLFMLDKSVQDLEEANRQINKLLQTEMLS